MKMVKSVGIRMISATHSLFCRLYRLGLAPGRWLHQHVSPAERQFTKVWPHIDSIEGLLVSGQERWLFCKAWRLPDGASIVEIGSYKGRSTCCLTYGCVGTKKHVYAIDVFKSNDADFSERNFFSEFKDNMKKCGLTEYVTPFVGKSAEVARTWDKPIDLLFIDGSHAYEDVVADFRSLFPWVVPGGIVALHDVGEGHGWPGPFRAWHENIKSQLVDIGACSTLAFGSKPRQWKC